ncbi:MAG: Rrf2 family transcriptional regulator [Acidimicrobiales bacterium]
MRLNEGVEWTLHCCTILGALPPDIALTSSRLAEFHGVTPSYLSKQLQLLKRAGIVTSAPGRKGGFRLAKAAADVSLLDVVMAIEGDQPAFRCTEIRQQGPSAVPVERYLNPCGIAAAMWRAEDAWREQLRETTIADLLAGLATSIDPEQLDKSIEWVTEVAL